MMQSENSTKTDELNLKKKKKKNVQEEEQKNYPDWKASFFVEMMVVSCCVAEIKGREDF